MPKKSKREQEIKLSIRDLTNLQKFYDLRALRFGWDAQTETEASRKQWLFDRQSEYLATAQEYGRLIEAAKAEAEKLSTNEQGDDTQ